MAAIAPGLVYAAAPTVITLAPGVSYTSAILFGQVNPNGKSTLWSLSYARAGQPLAAACTGDITTSLNALHTISCSVSGLTSSTSYHVQANGLNADGSAHGVDLAFTTLTNPEETVPTSPPSISLNFPIVEETSATLYGTVNPNGLTTNWQFFAGPDGTRSPQCSGNLPASFSASTVHCTLAGLTPGTMYTYLLTGTNSAGTRYTPIQSFTTRVPSTTSAAATQSDWAILSTSVNPTSPQVGNSVTLSMTFTLASTNAPLPQLVHVECQMDGALCGEGTITHTSPPGTPHQVNAETPWIATAGTHTVTWTLSTDNDPNAGNNLSSTTFTVPGSPSATTTSSSSRTESESTTIIETNTIQSGTLQSSTSQPTTVQTGASQQTGPTTVTVTSELLGGAVQLIQQNSLLLVGVLGVLVILLAALALKKRKPAQS